MEEKKKKKRKGFGPISIILLIVAFGVLGYSIWQLVLINNNYSGAQKEYEALADTFVGTVTKAPESAEAIPADEEDLQKDGHGSVVRIRKSTGGTESTASTAASGDNGGSGESVEYVPVPFSVDWAGLKAVNQEIVGWLHVDALPHIHYPICKGADNSFYLTHTFRRELYPSGSLFMDKNNTGDFTNAATYVYGHRMDDHSMFGDLKALESQSLVDQNPYFWIYTPEGVFCYQIFSVFEEPAESDVFAYHFEHDKDFLKWAKYVQSRSMVDTHTTVSRNEKVVVLATCTTDRVRRCLVFGKCISYRQPGEPEPTPTPTPKPKKKKKPTEVPENQGDLANENPGDDPQYDPANGNAGTDPQYDPSSGNHEGYLEADQPVGNQGADPQADPSNGSMGTDSAHGNPDGNPQAASPTPSAPRNQEWTADSFTPETYSFTEY